MTEKSERKKPIRLEWQGGLQSSGVSENAEAVQIKSSGNSKSAEKKAAAAPTHSVHQNLGQAGAQSAAQAPVALSGTVKVRRESKGRAGKPVAFLFEFSDPRARATQNLKELLSKLKTFLACGGGLEETGIVVQVDEIPRVIAALAKFGIEGKKSGG